MATVIATKTITRRDPETGRTTTITKGQTYKTTSRIYAAFSKRYADAFAPARRGAVDANKWTDEEYGALAAAYLRNGPNERACLAEFRLVSDRHTDEAIRLAVNSCKFLDTSVDYAKGLHDYANGLLFALQDGGGDRFQGCR